MVLQSTENRTIYVVDYECGSSFIHAFMGEKDLAALEERTKNGAVRIISLVCLEDSASR